jgi:hypothetical protein
MELNLQLNYLDSSLIKKDFLIVMNGVGKMSKILL